MWPVSPNVHKASLDKEDSSFMKKHHSILKNVFLFFNQRYGKIIALHKTKQWLLLLTKHQTKTRP